MRNPARIYGFGVIAVTIIACGMSASFNVVVDPYGSYQLFELTDVQSKPAIYRRVKLAKAYDLRRLKPEAIALGTSRSHLGLRMTHEGWGVPLGLRYNGGFDGATTKEMYAYLRHAQAVHPLRQVVLGLDTWQLVQGPAWTRPDFDPAILFEPDNPFHNLSVHAADLSLLISIDTTKASIAQLEVGNNDQPKWLAADGQRIGEIYFREIEPDYLVSPSAYFRNIDRQEIGFELDTGPVSPPRQTKFAWRAEETLTFFDYIEKIVAFCREQGIELRIFLTPAHAHQLEIASELGAWADIERGKRDLVDVLEHDIAVHPGSRPFPLYDFAGYSSVTTEPVPPLSTRSEMEYYWDSSHFKEGVGDWILDRLFGTTSGSNPIPDDFGVPLKKSNIETALEKIRVEQRMYRRKQPQESAFIKTLVEEVRAELARDVKTKHLVAIESKVERQ
jgi:hypothetical protein